MTVWFLVHIGHIMRKPVFGVSDQVILKPACSATENSKTFEMLCVASLDMIVSIELITKALIRLHGCAGWSAPLLFTHPIDSFFSHLCPCKIGCQLM